MNVPLTTTHPVTTTIATYRIASRRIRKASRDGRLIAHDTAPCIALRNHAAAVLAVTAREVLDALVDEDMWLLRLRWQRMERRPERERVATRAGLAESRSRRRALLRTLTATAATAAGGTDSLGG